MKNIFFILITACFINQAIGQVTIASAMYTTYHITPASIVQLNVLNTQSNSVEVVVESVVYNSNNEAILTVKSLPIWLKPGLSSLANQSLSFSSVQYAPTKQAEYVKNMRKVPSGIYRFCSTIYGVRNTEAFDYSCEDVSSDFSDFLVLAYPLDKDTVTVKNPLLVWNHSEPFDILLPGEYYKMSLVALKEGQSAEDALNMNIPLFSKDFLTSHQVQYPVDAPALTPGSTYAWQVQKITKSTVVNKSEAWQFIVPKPKEIVHQKYAALTREINASFTTVTSSQLLFHFQEEYASETGLTYKIYGNEKESIESTNSESLQNLDKKESPLLKILGNGRYSIDLRALKLNPDSYYTLETQNEKAEKQYLKFYIAPSAW